MLRFTYVLAVVLSFLSANASALDANGFEKLLATSNRGIGDEKGLQAKLSRIYYFQGVVDTVVGALDKETGEVYYAGPRKICLPRSVTLRPYILQAMTEQQVVAAERSNSLKVGWKSSNLNLFVFLALATNYPCTQR